MKYKTLARIILKLMGAFLAMQAFGSLAGSITSWVGESLFSDPPGSAWNTFIPYYAAGELVPLGAGLYLFFGGKWVVDKIIPSNRPYCHECGYDLSHNASPQCPECGVPVPPKGA